MSGDVKDAVFAAGCFWGVEHALAQTPGVLDTEVGYTGGSVEQPTYEQVCTGTTGHVEAVRVTYNPTQTSLENLVQVFFTIHDPTQQGGQGLDIGPQYESTVFFQGDEERTIAQRVRTEVGKQYVGKPIATTIRPRGTFWPAEEYHQGYIEKHDRFG